MSLVAWTRLVLYAQILISILSLPTATDDETTGKQAASDCKGKIFLLPGLSSPLAPPRLLLGGKGPQAEQCLVTAVSQSGCFLHAMFVPMPAMPLDHLALDAPV